MSDDCPRRMGARNPAIFKYDAEPDHWRDDGTCSYCGSLNPDTLMARIRAGDVELIPTDKNYKVYVRNLSGEMFKQTFRDCCVKDANGGLVFKEVEGGQRIAAIKEPACHGPGDCTHWTTREISETKFYFKHCRTEQMIEFIELFNARKLKIGYPGHFYVLPFFMRPKEVA